MFICGKHLAYANDFETLSTTKVITTIPSVYDIIYENEQYVCATNSGSLYTSLDGVTWTINDNLKLSSHGANRIYRITYFNGKYITAGRNGRCYYSTDLINWEKYVDVENYFTTNDQIYTLAIFRNELWIAGSSGKVMKTSDGNTWTVLNNPKVMLNNKYIYELKVLNNMLFLCCESKLITYKQK